MTFKKCLEYMKLGLVHLLIILLKVTVLISVGTIYLAKKLAVYCQWFNKWAEKTNTTLRGVLDESAE